MFNSKNGKIPLGVMYILPVFLSSLIPLIPVSLRSSEDPLQLSVSEFSPKQEKLESRLANQMNSVKISESNMGYQFDGGATGPSASPSPAPDEISS